jgi:hypothetical protein
MTMTVGFSRIALVATMGIAAACGAQTELSSSVTTMNRQGDALRARILSMAQFAGMADACSPGELRVFEGDSAQVAAKLLQELELLTISYGAGVPLDTPDGHTLLRAMARLETFGPGVAWDVASGPAPRTMNALTSIRLPNPETRVCEDLPGLDPAALIIPELTNWEVPRDSMKYPITIGYGPAAVNELRNWYYGKFGSEPDSALRYVRLTSHAMVGDYAVLSVERESERQGTVPLPQFRSGASYVLHKVGSEWRLIGYARVW